MKGYIAIYSIVLASEFSLHRSLVRSTLAGCKRRACVYVCGHSLLPNSIHLSISLISTCPYPVPFTMFLPWTCCCPTGLTSSRVTSPSAEKRAPLHGNHLTKTTCEGCRPYGVKPSLAASRFQTVNPLAPHNLFVLCAMILLSPTHDTVARLSSETGPFYNTTYRVVLGQPCCFVSFRLQPELHFSISVHVVWVG